MSQSKTHIAGPVVNVNGRILQRCCICGESLADYIRENVMAFGAATHRPGYEPLTFIPMTLIRVRGERQGRSFVVVEQVEGAVLTLPDDSCDHGLEPPK